MSQSVKPTGVCFCGCGTPTSPGRYFAQGHDRKAATTLDAISNPRRPILDRLIAEGFGPGGSRDLRAEALASGLGFTACDQEGCLVYGRGIGMRTHIQRAH
jgi:hypothetical protein